MRKALLFLVILLGIAVGVVYWLLADPNRFKSEITALIERETGLKLDLRGDLVWRLWPPVRLVARDLAADWVPPGNDPLVHIDSLELDADLWPLITGERRLDVNGVSIIGLQARLIERNGNANWLPPGAGKAKSVPLPVAAAPPGSDSDPGASWAVDVVMLRDSHIDYDLDGDKTALDIEELIVADVSPGQTSPVRGTFRVTSAQQRADLELRADVTAGEDSVRISDGELSGTITTPQLPFSATFSAVYDRARERATVEFDAAIDEYTIATEGASAIALGGAGIAALAIAAPAATVDPDLDEPILPLETIRDFDWNGVLRIARLNYDGAVFNDVRLTSAARAGELTGKLELPQFFGGSATSDWTIDARSTPRWHLLPNLQNIDSKALLTWLDQSYDWAAVLLGGADLAMTGNTARELAGSLKGKTTFDAGQGRLDIRGLRDLALTIAARAGDSDRIAAWPQILDYRRFTGTWDIDGIRHHVKVLLDNLSLELDGTLDPLTDALDMAMAVTVLDEAEYKTFQINPLLMGLALPMRCAGTVDDPKCKADEDGTRKLLAQAISGENPELKARLDKAIDEKVPEKYRDSARSLLDMLRKNQSKDKDNAAN